MIAWATDLVAWGGLPGVFLLMVAENLFPPIPSEVIMPLAGFAAAQGRMPLWGVVAAGTAGAVVGNAAWFELARAFGAARTRALLARHGRWVGASAEEVARAEAAMRRNGAAAVFLARFMPGVRTAISVPAGLVELPRGVFYACTAAGTLVWTGGLAVAGYALENHFGLVEEWTGPIGLGIAAAVALVVGVRVWRARRRGGVPRAEDGR